MSKSSYRKINIDGEMWRWKVGHSHISVRGPNKESFAPWIDELTEIEDVERAEWKGYLHITPRAIRAYIFKVTGRVDFLPVLQGIFNEEEYYGEYVGGTLSVKVDDQVHLLNMGDFGDSDTGCWLALCYLKYKSPSHRFYDTALKIVENNPEYKKELAIALLKASS